MPRTNEATSTDLKVIERLMQLGWPMARIENRGVRCFISRNKENK